MGTFQNSTPNLNDPRQRFRSERTQFESDWNAGRRPKIENFLTETSEPDRAALLRELLAMELHRMQCNGEEPNRNEYLKRFPNFTHIVEEQFEALNSFDIWSNSTATFQKKTKLPPTAHHKTAVPKRIADRYRLIEMLGKGGFGEVWRAHDEKLDSYVAIKGPRRDREIPPQLLMLAVSEARKVRQMKCAGFVPVLDVVDEGPLQFIVMELMDGGSMKRFIGKDNKPSHEQAASWVLSIADALHQAHLQGIVHRDIKPANILLNDKLQPFVADLGLAVSEEEQLREPSASLGTLNYMSPEQAEGKSNLVDSRSDIYSLGVLLYHLLTGRVPHLTERLSDYCRLVRKPGGPRPPRTIDDSIPNELEVICRKCLAYDVNDRYTTALDLSNELKSWLNRKQEKPLRKKPWKIAAAICLLVIATAVGFAAWNWKPDDKKKPQPKTPETEPVVVKKERFFQDLAPNEIEHGFWYDLHQRAPVQLHGAKRPPMTTISPFDSASKTLTVQCKDSILISFGNAPLRKYTLELEISQSRWIGSCGIFFGYRKTKGEFGSQGKFQLLHLQTTGPPRPRMCLYRAVEWIDEDERGTLSSVQSHTGKPEFLKMPKKRLSGRFEFTVHDGQLTDVRWCGDRLASLCGPEWNKKLKLSPEDYVGHFGVYNFASDGVYQNARIRFD